MFGGNLAISDPEEQSGKTVMGNLWLLVLLDHVSRAGWWRQRPVPLGTPDPVFWMCLLLKTSLMSPQHVMTVNQACSVKAGKVSFFPTHSLTLLVLGDSGGKGNARL